MNRIISRGASFLFLTMVVVAWACTLRPQALGGPAVFVAVRGSSMLPTYEHGDMVVVESAASYRVGDVVAYRVPAGEIGAGKIVIHRIIGGDAVTGFSLQGDHNTAPDPWKPTRRDMVGVAAIRVPNVGRLISLARQPAILAGLAAGVAVTLTLARPAWPAGPRPPIGRAEAAMGRRRCRPRIRAG